MHPHKTGTCQVKFRLLQLKYFEYFPPYLGVAQKVMSNHFFSPATDLLFGDL